MDLHPVSHISVADAVERQLSAAIVAGKNGKKKKQEEDRKSVV